MPSEDAYTNSAPPLNADPASFSKPTTNAAPDGSNISAAEVGAVAIRAFGRGARWSVPGIGQFFSNEIDARNAANEALPRLRAREANIRNLTTKILQQSSYDKWTGQGFGTIDANARHMATRLADAGLTRLEDFGTRNITTQEYYSDEYGSGYTPVTRTEFFNKATGQAIRGDGQGGSTFDITYAGDGSTTFNVAFNQMGMPIFYTQYGGDTSDWGTFAPILAFASIIPSPIQPFAQAIQAIAAYRQGNEIGAILSAIGAAYSFGAQYGTLDPSSVNYVNSMDAASDAAAGVGTSTITTAANWIAANAGTIKTAQQAVLLLNALDKKNLAGVIAGLTQIAPQVGVTIPESAVTPIQTAALASAVSKGDWVGASMIGSTLFNNSDLRLAGKGIQVANAVKSGNPIEMLDSVLDFNQEYKLVQARDLQNAAKSVGVPMNSSEAESILQSPNGKDQLKKYQTAVDDAKRLYKSESGQDLPDIFFEQNLSKDFVSNADDLYTTRSEARELFSGQLGYTPSDSELDELIGLPTNRAKSVVDDKASTTYDEAEAFLKNVYGDTYTPTKEDINSLLGMREVDAARQASSIYTKDKNEVTEDELGRFLRNAGLSESDVPPDLLSGARKTSEAGAISYINRLANVQETTFDGEDYGSQENARRAAEAAGYNSYTYGGRKYDVPAENVDQKKIESEKYRLVEGVLKQQGTTIQDASDAQLKNAMDLVDKVPTNRLASGAATVQDVISGRYAPVTSDGKFRVEVMGVTYTAESATDKQRSMLPAGVQLATENEVWGADGSRNSGVELVTLANGQLAYVKPAPNQNPEFVLKAFDVSKSLDEIAETDPAAWLNEAQKFYKNHDQTAKLGDYLASTANKIMLGAYATGNQALGDSVKQTLSVVTQGVGEQMENLATFFTDRLGMDHNSALAASGKALQTWGAANQSSSTKAQEDAIKKAVTDAQGVGNKIGAFVNAAFDNPGGFASMVAKEGVQEVLPLWAAKAAYRLGSLAAYGANTAVEAMESWGSGVKSTYDQAKKMGYSDEDSRVMASKVGLQNALITTVTNGFGDVPLVNRIIGEAARDSVAGITKAGVREGFTEYFDELGQNAVQQYQLTKTVNWDQATTAATIGMGVGAGTTSGIMLGATINDSAFVGKDANGNNVTFGEFMSGTKQVNMNTFNMNAQVGTAQDGDPITVSTITAMPMATGISYETVKTGLPPSLTGTNVVVGKDALGNNITLSSLMSEVNENTSFDTLYRNLLNTTPEQRVEAQTDFLNTTLTNLGYKPTKEEVSSLITAAPAGSDSIRQAAASYADTHTVTYDEAKKMLGDAYAAQGFANYAPTDEEINRYIASGAAIDQTATQGQVGNYVGGNTVTYAEAEQIFKNTYGYTPNKAEVDQFVAVINQDTQASNIGSYVNPRQVTRAEAEQYFRDIGYTPTEQEINQFIRSGQDVSDVAVKSELGTYVDPLMVDDQEVRDALAALGFPDATDAQVKSLAGQYAEAQLAGLAEKNLTKFIYQALKDQNAQLQQQIGTQARTATQTDIDALSEMLGGQRSVDLAYDVTGDKQITQADIDYLRSVVSGTKPEWAPPAGTVWGGTGLYGQIAQSEAQRQADIKAAEEQRQRDIAAQQEAAKEAERRGALRSTAGQAAAQIQQVIGQLPQAIKGLQTTTTPIYGGETSPFDLNAPLDVGFFEPSKEKQGSQTGQQTTKIATGGYLDDLLDLLR